MRWGHLPQAEHARGVKLAAVCDPVVAQAEALLGDAQKPVPIHTDFKKMIDTEKLDAVVISTPHYQHYAQALYALRNGLHVLVEKPLTIKAKHARALIELARKKRRILQIGYQRHHWPEYRYVRDLVAKGKLGRLQAVVGYITQDWGCWPGPKSWRYDPELSGGGMLMDSGSHIVAASLFVSGQKVREVSAYIDNQGMEVDILAAISARFESGAVCTIATIGGTGPHHDERLGIYGTEGYAAIDQNGWHVSRAFMNEAPMVVPKSFKSESPDAAFFRWIANGGKGYELPYYAIEVANISQAAYKSSKTRKPTRVAR